MNNGTNDTEPRKLAGSTITSLSDLLLIITMAEELQVKLPVRPNESNEPWIAPHM
jgi:hypothetical protein